MNLTFSSLITTFFFSSISIVLLWILLKNNEYIQKTGIHILMLCVILNTVSLVIPFEFFFSKSIYIELIWPKIYRFIMLPIIKYNNFEFSPLDILYSIWIFGMLCSLSKLILSYLIMSKNLKQLEPLDNPTAHTLLHQIQETKKKTVHFHLVSSNEILSPFIFGTVTPYIVIPMNLDMSVKDFYFILKHEVEHYYNGDLTIKLFFSILTCIYWWNPFLYLLQNQITKILEINIDKLVTNGWSDEMKMEYLNCLVVFAKDTLISAHNRWAFLFKSGDFFVISQRVHIMLNDIDIPAKPSLLKNIPFLLLLLFFFFFPTFVTFEAWYISPEIEQESFTLDTKDAFYLENNNGTYDLYIDNKFILTVTEIFDSNIKIIERENKK